MPRRIVLSLCAPTSNISCFAIILTLAGSVQMGRISLTPRQLSGTTGSRGGRVSLEDSLKSWARAPGTTEQQKCENAVTAVRKAIAASEKLSKLTITIEPQGSYHNQTNFREDSDVDHQWQTTAVSIRYQPKDEPAHRAKYESRGYDEGDLGIRFVKVLCNRR